MLSSRGDDFAGEDISWTLFVPGLFYMSVAVQSIQNKAFQEAVSVLYALMKKWAYFPIIMTHFPPFWWFKLITCLSANKAYSSVQNWTTLLIWYLILILQHIFTKSSVRSQHISYDKMEFRNTLWTFGVNIKLWLSVKSISDFLFLPRLDFFAF